MNCHKSFFGLFLAALVLLPGCMRVPTYQCKSLKLAGDHCMYRGTENNVIVQTKLLSREDKNALFGDRSASIHNNDIQVIHLSINNLSNVKYLLSPADINLSMMSCRDVARLMKTNSVNGLAGGIACSATATGAVYGSFVFGMLMQSVILANGALAIGIVSAGAALTFFGVSIKSMVMNRRISKDLRKKTLSEKVSIKSGDHYEGLIFVRSADYTSQFNVTLHEKDSKKNILTFNVDVRNNES